MTLRVRCKAAAAVVDITDLIGMGGFYADDMRDALSTTAKGANNITVRLTSDGGDITQGLAIYSMLKAHGARVRVEVLGVAASMGSVIAMAGDTIAMAEDAFMMVHNPASGVDGESGDLRERADLLDKMRDTIAAIYARRTGNETADIIAAMNKETWMTATEAKALGYCDEIIPAKAMAARVRRFRNAPKALQRANAKGQGKMDPELLKSLGLGEDATLEDVLAAIQVLQTAAAPADDDDTEEEKPADADDDDTEEEKPPAKETAAARARREIRAVTRERTESTTVKLLQKLVARVDAIGTRVDGNERDSLMRAHAKKFTPKLEKMAARWPIAQLKEFIAAADDRPDADEEIIDTGERGASRVNGTREIKLTAEELNVAKLTGQDPTALLAFKKNGLKLVKKGA